MSCILEHRLCRWLSSKQLACQCRRHEFNPWVGKTMWRRTLQPTPVFWPGESHVQRSLEGYSPWGCKELNITWVDWACTSWNTCEQSGMGMFQGCGVWAGKIITWYDYWERCYSSFVILKPYWSHQPFIDNSDS